MLVCPECQFENPEDNKFCQRCGTSLTHGQCQECGASFPYGALNCPACDAETAKIWLALIAEPRQRSATAIASIDAETTPSGSKPEMTTQTQAEATTLDRDHRYHLYDGVAATTSPPPLIAHIQLVWDSQPLHKAFLEQLLEQTSAESEVLIKAIPDSPASSLEFWRQLGVPEMALPYLVLQESLAPAVPALQDAWRDRDREILLIEDRRDWSRLADVWGDSSLPFSQLLYWLNEMAKLWPALAAIHCTQSLLAVENLCVDEDQALCLQFLHTNDASAAEPTLQDLGRLWQQLFDQTGRTQYGPLAQLLSALLQAQVTTAEELRSHLHDIDNQQDQSTNNPTTAAADDPAADESDMVTVGAPADPENIIYRSVAEEQPTIVLPMQVLSLSDAGSTDIGQDRDHNEDNYGIETLIGKQESALSRTLSARGTYIVCDGMGGHAAGEVASAMAVETLQAYLKAHWQPGDDLPPPDIINQAILAANQQIYAVNQENARSGSGRMGTTLVMMLVQDAKVAIAHVGDSRIYRLTRKSGLEQVTTDHEVGQREIQRGVDPEVAYARPDAYQLTQALGPRETELVKPDIVCFEVKEDTLFLLCSDGLSDNNFLEDHYQELLTPLISTNANLEQGVLDLIAAANNRNGHDNITAVVARIKMRPNPDQM
ncbi:MAG: serine/threonine phosphatase [Spirulinaceae cyanobacterium RM2_2_10]|nr:serine/threonine phosphatase [Spirulinaceae cyanobacterium SM2_1_0]NJO20257.1 serine/threonine phosphatase [Spirulinaceae cyanobacterium RM2_2_10]